MFCIPSNIFFKNSADRFYNDRVPKNRIIWRILLLILKIYHQNIPWNIALMKFIEKVLFEYFYFIIIRKFLHVHVCLLSILCCILDVYVVNTTLWDGIANWSQCQLRKCLMLELITVIILLNIKYFINGSELFMILT